jgi:hypothetical protein
MAKKNGDDIVYNCSDCGENYVRYYGFGGDGPGSACDTHALTPAAIKFIHQHPDKNHIWYEVLADTDWKKVREKCGCDVCKQNLNDETDARSFLTKFGDWFVNLPIW